MYFVLLFAILIFNSSVSGTCIANCSSHGVCNNGVCTCQQDWSGDDCSIQITTLQSGVSVSAEVAAWSWHYFVIQNPQAGGGVRVDLTPQVVGDGSDCDLFIRFNSLPSSFAWDAVNVDWGTQASLIATNTNSGLWYIGVYANFMTCQYTIVATLTGGCATGCINGECTNGACVCRSGWAGVDCSTSVPTPPLELGHLTTGSVESMGWKYYYVDLAAAVSELDITVNITSIPILLHDCDIYVKYNAIPSVVSWDYQDSSFGSFISIVIPDAAAGKWYIGFWGFRQCDFILLVSSVVDTCTSQCSYHGQCGPPCHCSLGYDGDYCQNKTQPLASDEVVSGYVEQNAWNYYKYIVSDVQSNIEIIVNQTTAGSDCDVYVKVDQEPSRWNYDYLEISTSNYFKMVISDVVGRTLHIGIFGWLSTGYIARVITTQACVTPCAHGTCYFGICNCDGSWSGAACDQLVPLLTSGSVVTDSILRENEWKYYSFRSNATTVIVSLREIESTSTTVGLVNLYVAEREQPTLRRFDYLDTSSSKPFHTVTLPLDNRKGEIIDWFIGVYGTIFVLNPVNYKLVVWQPPQ